MKILPLLGFAIAGAFGGPTAHATLIGDTLFIQHRWPNYGSVTAVENTVVQVGPGDIVIGTNGTYAVNPEESSIRIDFLKSGQFGPAAFNGVVVQGITDTITGFSVSTNMVGWVDSRFSFDAHSFSANWSTFDFDEDIFFNVRLTLTTTTSPVPEGGSAMAMLGMAMIGLVAARRRS